MYSGEQIITEEDFDSRAGVVRPAILIAQEDRALLNSDRALLNSSHKDISIQRPRRPQSYNGGSSSFRHNGKKIRNLFKFTTHSRKK